MGKGGLTPMWTYTVKYHHTVLENDLLWGSSQACASPRLVCFLGLRIIILFSNKQLCLFYMGVPQLTRIMQANTERFLYTRMKNSLLQTVRLVPGERKPLHFLLIQHAQYRHFLWPLQCPYWLGLTVVGIECFPTILTPPTFCKILVETKNLTSSSTVTPATTAQWRWPLVTMNSHHFSMIDLRECWYEQGARVWFMVA